MKTIWAPFLGLQFYWRDTSGQDSLNRVVMALLEGGATFAGTVTAEVGAGARDATFEYPYVDHAATLQVRDLDEYEKYANNPDYRLYNVMLYQATGTTKRAEIVTTLGVSKKAASIDNHPIGIWTEGEIFCWPEPNSKQRSGAKKSGAILTKKFLELNSVLLPDYAVITVEEQVPCLSDAKGGYSEFRDFYLKKEFPTPSKFARILEECSSCYLQETAAGFYVSSYKYFNPRNVSVTDKDISEFVAGILAS